MLTNKQVYQYLMENGHVPLVIGVEYLYNDNFYRLIEASIDYSEVTIESRFGERSFAEKTELIWKPAR